MIALALSVKYHAARSALFSWRVWATDRTENMYSERC